MSDSHHSFTPRHQEIFDWLLTVTPENWRAQILEGLGNGNDGDVLYVALASVRQQREYLSSLTRDLPPFHHLPGYFFTTGAADSMFGDADTVQASVRGEDGGGPDFLRLPGTDLAETVRGLYRHLDNMIAMGEELEGRIQSLINALPLFHDRGNMTPYKEIRELPPIITRDQRISIATALASGHGVIDLSDLNKTNASYVLFNLELAMNTKGLTILTAHKQAIEIKCYQESYQWYGTGKGGTRGRDWVKHHAGASNAIVLPELTAWATSIL